MWVEVRCSDPRLAFRGEWPGREGPEELVASLLERAREGGIPIQLTIQGHGTWSLAPTGRVVRGALFLEEKLTGRRGSRREEDQADRP